jgi:hypothetical protein
MSAITEATRSLGPRASAIRWSLSSTNAPARTLTNKSARRLRDFWTICYREGRHGSRVSLCSGDQASHRTNRHPGPERPLQRHGTACVDRYRSPCAPYRSSRRDHPWMVRRAALLRAEQTLLEPPLTSGPGRAQAMREPHPLTTSRVGSRPLPNISTRAWPGTRSCVHQQVAAGRAPDLLSELSISASPCRLRAQRLVVHGCDHEFRLMQQAAAVWLADTSYAAAWNVSS